METWQSAMVRLRMRGRSNLLKDFFLTTGDDAVICDGSVVNNAPYCSGHVGVEAARAGPFLESIGPRVVEVNFMVGTSRFAFVV